MCYRTGLCLIAIINCFLFQFTFGGKLQSTDGLSGGNRHASEIGCPQGFHGKDCQLYNDCASYPCLNGGTCEDTTEGYICHCVPGTTGQTCDIAINECESSPCLNAATCVDGLNSYMCVCQPGNTGSRCETDVNECASLPCQFNGTCSDHLNGYTCACPSGYSGLNCQYEPCVFFITEHGYPGAGLISKVDEHGKVTRLTVSGECNENGIAVDGSLLFYTTFCNPYRVWRISTDNPCSTKSMFYESTSGIVALAISRRDKRLFVDNTNIMRMFDYRGRLLANVTAGKTTYTHGMAVDEIQRQLYYTDRDSDCIYAVGFTTSTFTGTPTIVLSGLTNVGDIPDGLVYSSAEDKLFWILEDTAEIRSLKIGSSTSEIVAPALNSQSARGLTMCGDDLVYVNNGVWRLSREDGSRVLITDDMIGFSGTTTL